MLSVRRLAKRFAGRPGETAAAPAVDDVSLEVEPGMLFTLLGPSGCGKTTTLRCIAGLERPDAGDIAVGGRTLFSARDGVSVPANRRRIGMVSQSYGLWPHMTVLRTVAFPLQVGPRRERPPARELRRRVERALAVVRLEGLEERRPAELSGGQQQRLALARALVVEPSLLLMDEPLSNLDARLREQMHLELKRLQRDLGVTAVHVTHDQAEALALSNRIAVMRDGRVEQIGKPRELYERPRSRFVAEFLANPNLIDGRVEEVGAGGSLVSSPQGTLRLSGADLTPGDPVLVAVHPEHVELELALPADGRPNVWRGVVRNRAFRGDAVEHVVAVGTMELRARCEPSVSIPAGTPVAVVLPEAACSLVPSCELARGVPQPEAEIAAS